MSITQNFLRDVELNIRIDMLCVQVYVVVIREIISKTDVYRTSVHIKFSIR